MMGRPPFRHIAFEFERPGLVARIRLHRPEVRNAIDPIMIEEVRRAAEEAVRAGARAAVLCGEGKVFCAGADIAWMEREGRAGLRENRESALALGSFYRFLDTLPLPLVAAVHGAAIGGAVGLVAAADVAVAEEGTVFALSEVRIGLVPAVISPYVIARVGPARARDLFLTGRRFDASEAYRIGLADRVAPRGGLDEAVREVLSDLLEGAPQAQSRAKRLIRMVSGRRPEDVAGFTAGEIARARAGEEGREGLRAFLEKRPPVWSPRTSGALETDPGRSGGAARGRGGGGRAGEGGRGGAAGGEGAGGSSAAGGGEGGGGRGSATGGEERS